MVDYSFFHWLNSYKLSHTFFKQNYYIPKGGEYTYVDTIKSLMRDKIININGNAFSDVVNIKIDIINFLNNI